MQNEIRILGQGSECATQHYKYTVLKLESFLLLVIVYIIIIIDIGMNNTFVCNKTAAFVCLYK